MKRLYILAVLLPGFLYAQNFTTQDTANAVTPGTAPSRALAVGGVYNTTPPTLTTGQMGQAQLDSLGNFLTRINTPLPSGSNTIGGVSITAALPTGSNAIGMVAVNAALPAGANTIGGVNIIAALPTGANTIGIVSMASPLPAGTNTLGTVVGAAANGAAVSGNPNLIAGIGSGNASTLITCDSSVAISTSSAATIQLVPISGSTKIYVCGYHAVAGGATSVTFEYGTGSLCATGLTTLTGAFGMSNNISYEHGGGLGTIFRTTAGQALCLVNSASVQVSGVLTYTQF